MAATLDTSRAPNYSTKQIFHNNHATESGSACRWRITRIGVLSARKTSGEADFGRSFRVVAGPETVQARESCVTRCL